MFEQSNTHGHFGGIGESPHVFRDSGDQIQTFHLTRLLTRW